MPHGRGTVLLNSRCFVDELFIRNASTAPHRTAARDRKKQIYRGFEGLEDDSRIRAALRRPEFPRYKFSRNSRHLRASTLRDFRTELLPHISIESYRNHEFETEGSNDSDQRLERSSSKRHTPEARRIIHRPTFLLLIFFLSFSIPAIRHTIPSGDI